MAASSLRFRAPTEPSQLRENERQGVEAEGGLRHLLGALCSLRKDSDKPNLPRRPTRGQDKNQALASPPE
jgi:hypothetical protein